MISVRDVVRGTSAPVRGRSGWRSVAGVAGRRGSGGGVSGRLLKSMRSGSIATDVATGAEEAIAGVLRGRAAGIWGTRRGVGEAGRAIGGETRAAGGTGGRAAGGA